MYGYVSNSNHFTGKKSFKTKKKKRKSKYRRVMKTNMRS